MARMRRCVALLVLAVGASQAKRTLHESGVAGQIDAARDQAVAAVPQQLDVTANKVLAQAADSLVPQDFQSKVQAAMKNFQSGDKTINPQIKEYAKLISGVLMLDASGDSNIANQSLGEILQQLVKFTFDLAKVYITAPEKVVTELPRDLAKAISHSQPQNFAAWFADHEQVYKDLLGVVYKPDDGVGSLTHPQSVALSSTVLNYAPCIVSNTPTGFNFGAQALNIVPSVLQSAPFGANFQPQGINIQPALIYVFPSGFNVQPQGLNIGPALIAVTPGGFAQVSKGGVIAPSLLSVSVAQPPS